MMHSNLSTNLHHLVRHLSGSSQAAEVLGINRQQLYKYLSGLSTPSLPKLQRIARYFELEPDDLLLPPEQFLKRWRKPVRVEGLPPQVNAVFGPLLENMAQTCRDLTRYCGGYHVYTRLVAGKISRAYANNAQDGDWTMIRMDSYANSRDEVARNRPPTKLTGLVLWLGERFYIIGAQDVGKTNARLYNIILYPPALPSSNFLTGMLMTADNARTRPICTSPIVFERLNSAEPSKANLQNCGVFHEGDPRLGASIVRLLQTM